jgi:hypothetical protein
VAILGGEKRKMNVTKKALAIICVAALLCSAGLVLATYTMTSAPVTGSVSAPEATLSLALDKTAIVAGESWTLTATVSDGASGVTINFLEGSSSVGSAVTGVGGVATLTLTPAVGSHTYTATGEHP